MREFTQPLRSETLTVVNSTNTAVSVKSGSLPVYATPMMLALMEEATCKAVVPLLEDNETTVGTKVSITHEKACPTGTTIVATAILEEVDGRRLYFSVSAKDDKGDIIGKGTIERFVVYQDKFMKRVNV